MKRICFWHDQHLRSGKHVLLNGSPATIVHARQGTDPTGKPAVWLTVDVTDEFDVAAMLTGSPSRPTRKDTPVTNPLEDAFKHLGETLGAGLEKVGVTMAAQFAVDSAMDGDASAVRERVAGLTPQQREQVRHAMKLVAKTIKGMDAADG